MFTQQLKFKRISLFPSQIRCPLKMFDLKHGFKASATYLFSIIIRSCFLDGNISEVHIYSVKILRTENQGLLLTYGLFDLITNRPVS